MVIACGALAGSSLNVAMARLPSRWSSPSSPSSSHGVARIPPALRRPVASACAVKEEPLGGDDKVEVEKMEKRGLTNPLALSLSLSHSLSLSLLASPHAMAAQELASDSDSDPRGLLLLGVLFPAIAWVLFNILQPALNQINKMRSGK